MFRAFPVFESEGSRRLARRELGCDPCREISTRDGLAPSSSNRTLFIDPDAGVTIHGEQILSIHQDRAESEIVVYVRLRDDAQKSVAALRGAVQDAAATYIAGKLVGVGPIEMADSNFAIALVESPALAEEIAASLRTDTQRER